MTHSITGRPNIVSSAQLRAGCSLSELTTKTGLALDQWHHRLLGHSHPELLRHCVDFSRWFALSTVGDEYYLRFLALFVVHGILFENFLSRVLYEARFARTFVVPGFDSAAKVFGVRPLIVSLLPIETEDSDHWRHYPRSLREAALCITHARNGSSAPLPESTR